MEFRMPLHGCHPGLARVADRFNDTVGWATRLHGETGRQVLDALMVNAVDLAAASGRQQARQTGAGLYGQRVEIVVVDLTVAVRTGGSIAEVDQPGKRCAVTARSGTDSRRAPPANVTSGASTPEARTTHAATWTSEDRSEPSAIPSRTSFS